eukprot:283730_1
MLLLNIFVLCSMGTAIYFEDIIVGAGIGGVGMGYYLETSQHTSNYTILERNSIAASFFNKYPIHNKLLSINKIHTGFSHNELNLRHDWNSLLSTNMSNTYNSSTNNKFRFNINNEMNFSIYSTDYYPDRQDFVRYINDYTKKYNIKIQYNTTVNKISLRDDGIFVIKALVTKSTNLIVYECKHLFIATGLFKPHIPEITGIEYAIGYENLSTNLTQFMNKHVAIFGSGNSGWEIAQHISQVTAHTHIIMRSRPKFAYETHYVGDIRSINMEFIDHYLLKSMDALGKLNVSIKYSRDDNKYYLLNADVDTYDYVYRAWELRDGYDIIIRATGFEFDYSIFDENILKKIYNDRNYNYNYKYPLMNNMFEAKDIKNMYFLGTLMHALDYKKSAGGFVHGYRYYIK